MPTIVLPYSVIAEIVSVNVADARTRLSILRRLIRDGRVELGDVEYRLTNTRRLAAHFDDAEV